MYLSKVELAPRWAANPYHWHRALWQLFPGRSDSARDFLFRAEAGIPNGNLQVLLQSSSAPLSGADGVSVQAQKKFELSMRTGQRLKFHITANPVKTIQDAAGRQNRRGEPKACRVPIVRFEQQQAWLQRKLKGAAQLLEVEAANRQALYFRRRGAAGKVVPVGFQGVLIVENPQQLAELVRSGIGPAKSFGCGLLSLARG